MNRDQRKQAIQARPEDNESGPVTLSELAFRQALEEEEHSSESRFDVARTPELLVSIVRATSSFQAGSGLKVTVTGNADNIPDMPRDGCFKYSHPRGDGDLFECSQRIISGEKITLAFVCEDGLLIGYGIAVSQGAKSEIEIIDVDCYSRREADFAKTVEFNRDVFPVGVAHVIVVALMQACVRPIKVDATTPHSRYVFKSLGFVHDADESNPCILRLE